MNRIESLNELIETLDDCEPEDYIKLAKQMKIPNSDFEKYAHWRSDGYCRNCIERTDTYELVLICWNPGDETPKHGHSGQRCWVYQVDGEINEVRYKVDEAGVLVPCNEMQLNPGRLTYIVDTMGYHSLSNNSNKRAMTLHLYISPIDSCKVFDTTENSFKVKELKYDSYKGVLVETQISS
ncbi:MAG: cysteine dioxygenase family protein [Flavobacteriaceae bacterium]|nr:cysteine dioxygenase family protein [Flavobacteriaceae bacterium]